MQIIALLLTAVSFIGGILFIASFFTPKFAVFSRSKSKKAGLITWGLIAVISMALAAPLQPDSPTPPAQQAAAGPQPVSQEPAPVAAPEPPAKPKPLYAAALKGQDTAFEARVRERIKNRHGEGVVMQPIAQWDMDSTDMDGAIYAKYRLFETPLALDAAMADAREVALFMVEELLAMGINPGAENIVVSLRLDESAPGLTGQDKIRAYGRWKYDPATDELAWLPPGE